MLKSFSPVILVALCASAQAQTQKPLAQSQNGDYTLRVLKAKWATTREIASFGPDDRALTVWVDVTSTKPFVPTKEEIETKRLTLVSRLIDGRRKDNGADSQLISVGADRYGREIPYIPAASPPGQMIWRVQGVDPRAQDVLLEWEFLVPGSIPKKSNWPAALLKKENAGQQISKNDNAETRRFSIRLPLNTVEAPTPLKFSTVPLKAVAAGGNSWQIWSATAHKITSSVTSAYGAPSGLSSPNVESWQLSIPVVKSGADTPWRFDLRDAAGYEWPAGSSFQYDRSSIQYWRPDGTLLGANEQAFDLSARFAPQLAPDGKWTLEGRRETDGQLTFSSEFSGVKLSQTTAQLPQSGMSAWKVREIRRFSEDNPLPTAKWAPIGQKAGVALKLALTVPQPDVAVRAYLSDASVSDGHWFRLYQDELMVIGRETAPTDSTILFQAILPPVEEETATIGFKLNATVNKQVEPKIVIEGLSFQTAKPKSPQ